MSTSSARDGRRRHGLRAEPSRQPRRAHGRGTRAGKHVFVEKPLALTDDELDAWSRPSQAPDEQLWGGFNRRHASASTAARRALGAGGGPLVLNYRVNAGRLPDTHWYKDRRQGGRLLGEVCHFIDLASWIVGDPAQTSSRSGRGQASRCLQEDLVVSLRFGDGSLATITYAEHGHAGTAKERLEILGRGRRSSSTTSPSWSSTARSQGRRARARAT